MWDWTKTKKKIKKKKPTPRRVVRPTNMPVKEGVFPKEVLLKRRQAQQKTEEKNMPRQHMRTQQDYSYYEGYDDDYSSVSPSQTRPMQEPKAGLSRPTDFSAENQNVMTQSHVPQAPLPFEPRMQPPNFSAYPSPDPRLNQDIEGHSQVASQQNYNIPPNQVPNTAQSSQAGYMQAPYPQENMSRGYEAQPQGFSDPNSNFDETSDEETIWSWYFDQYDLPGMELHEVVFVSQSSRWKAEMRKAFKRARRDFLKFVGYHHVTECESIGLDAYAIKRLKLGRSPENYNVHMKIPLDYGGTNDFSNLCLIQTHPYHEELHKFIDMQIALQPPNRRSKKLFIPVPTGKVYMPEGFASSPGGKDKHDRSVYAGFLENVFEEIRLKNAMGR